MQKLKPLAIKEFGMVSSLGVGAELNASAMRCGYDGFESADRVFLDKTGLTVAPAPLSMEIRGKSRLREMAKLAVEDLLFHVDDVNEVTLCVCMSHLLRDGVTARQDVFDSITQGVLSGAAEIIVRKKYGFSGGRTSFGVALQKTQELLYTQQTKAVLIVAVDSLLSPTSIRHYLNGNTNRLLTEKNSDGFIPGEAAVAILVTKPEYTETTTHIRSIGFAKEPVTIENEEEVFKAEGLIQSTFNALAPLNIDADDTDFRISSVSGEKYFFTELTLTHGKTMKKARTEHPLWHPADCIGEVSAAMGGAMLVMVHYAFMEQYAPGNKALYHLSNDNSERFTFVLEYTNG